MAASTRLLVLLALHAACSSPRDHLPEIRRIYAQAALDEVRNPVIVIHGILGSQLRQHSADWQPGGEDPGVQPIVWGAFTSEAVDPETPEGARAVALPLEIPGSAREFDPSRERVYATGPLERLDVSFLSQILAVDVYKAIIAMLGAGGFTDRVDVDPNSPAYADDHYTCFSFFYDWRRDNVENAIQLAHFVREKRVEIGVNATRRIQRLRAEGGATALHEADRIEDWLAGGYRFDIVAHSMGGLIARYYLRYGEQDLPDDGSLPELTWAGAEEVDRLVAVATPNLGSMDALVNLLRGYRAAFFLPSFDPAVLGTMPSLYQMLPRARQRLVVDGQGDPLELDFSDPTVWEANRWGILDPEVATTLAWLLPDQPDPVERRHIARDYVYWCLERARRFQAALDRPALGSPARLTLYAADAEPTLVRVRIDRIHGRLLPSFDGAGLNDIGDGTVPRYSAVGDERFGSTERERLRSPIPWSHVTFLSDDHIGLTKNVVFANNVLFELIEEPLLRPPPGSGSDE